MELKSNVELDLIKQRSKNVFIAAKKNDFFEVERLYSEGPVNHLLDKSCKKNLGPSIIISIKNDNWKLALFLFSNHPYSHDKTTQEILTSTSIYLNKLEFTKILIEKFNINLNKINSNLYLVESFKKSNYDMFEYLCDFPSIFFSSSIRKNINFNQDITNPLKKTIIERSYFSGCAVASAIKTPQKSIDCKILSFLFDTDVEKNAFNYGFYKYRKNLKKNII